MTNVVVDGLRANGITLDPLFQDDRHVSLSWDPADEILGTRALIVVPDIHFATGADGDVFANGTATAVGTRPPSTTVKAPGGSGRIE